ncbi:hypothetical protein QJS10_CPA02g01160 [Acorus calamus]|uniref:Uncharacterized protein n=1 Tax=Acorus calamus TaxID=4465 RepID=A0AAV9FDJ4_ACOCL|nr:hypothetical protein QJS10_CPA02g01160 [Acorus calamus]
MRVNPDVGGDVVEGGRREGEGRGRREDELLGFDGGGDGDGDVCGAGWKSWSAGRRTSWEMEEVGKNKTRSRDGFHGFEGVGAPERRPSGPQDDLLRRFSRSPPSETPLAAFPTKSSARTPLRVSSETSAFPPTRSSSLFDGPGSIVVGGSYSIGSAAKPGFNVDLLVRMPKECFREKDFLNHRYHAKRCLYLTVIKKQLESCQDVRRIEWSTFQNEARKPVLLVHPVNVVEGSEFFIRIIPTATLMFDAGRLNLSRSNVRSLNEEGASQTTPKYNNSILEDMLLEENMEFIKKAFLGRKELAEALLLLNIWARQRSSIYTHDCLNGFILSAIVAYLATGSGGNRIDTSMNRMQIFRITLKFIATSNLLDKGISLQALSRHNVSEERKLFRDMNKFRQSFDVVLRDSSGQYNLAFRMTRAAFLQLRDEVSCTLDCMEKCKDGGFEEIFITTIDFAAKFDFCMRVNLKGNSKVYTSGFCMDAECWSTYKEEVRCLLERGLTDRANSIRVIWNSTPSQWNVEDGFTGFGNEPLLIGILASSHEKIFRVVDIGPDAEDKLEVIKFRKFWGEKAELRRFKDGVIAESTDPISFSGGLLEAFEVLSKRLRSVEDIPLKISSVQPLDSAFRSMAVFPPQPHLLAEGKSNDGRRSTKYISTCIKSLEVMIQLEGSGSWPMDEVAIEKTKTAFLLKIGESLQNKWGMNCIASEDEVNILMSGYAFCLRIMHERGLTVLRKHSVGNDQKKPVLSSDKELFVQGQHSSMTNGLYGRFITYGPVVRFLRLLSDYDWNFSPLIVDINNDFTLKDKQEINEIFIISRKTNEVKAKEMEPAMFLATSYDKRSQAWTKFSPSSWVLKRIVSYARSSAAFLTNLILRGQSGPYTWEVFILSAAFDALGLQCLFRTPLNNYDAVILLHKEKLPFPQRLLFPAEMTQGKKVIQGKASKDFQPYMSVWRTNESLEEARNKLMVNFDPTRCFLEDLQTEFPDTFNVWYDSLGGDMVGLTWEKQGSKKRQRGEEEVDEPRRDPTDVLKEVGLVGKGLVKSVHLLKAPRH